MTKTSWHNMPWDLGCYGIWEDREPDHAGVVTMGADKHLRASTCPTRAAWQEGANTGAQTVCVPRSIVATLSDHSLLIRDVVRVQGNLDTPDARDGMEFARSMAGCTQFVGTEIQPQFPVGSVIEVAGLANPAWLVGIGVTAVRPAAQ